MSKQTNTVAVGAFVAGAFLILFGVLFYLSGNVLKRDVDRGLVVFDGSVRGLKIGAPVAFKGVEIGQVVDFDVFVDSDTLEVVTPVLLEVSTKNIKHSGKDTDAREDLASMIERGLRAQLQVQSLLTGLLYVQIDFYPRREARFTAEDLAKYDIPKDVLIIPTIPTDLERLSRSLQELDLRSLAENVEKTLKGIDGFVNNPKFQALPENISATLAAIDRLSQRLDREMQALSPGLDTLITEAGGTMKTLNADLPALSQDTHRALSRLNASLVAAQQTMANADYLMSDDSAVLFEISQAAKELGAAGRALQSLAETLETQPESLLKGKSPLGN